MTSKTDCLAYLSRQLISTSQWRCTQSIRFPDDPRNEMATKSLWRLVTQANEISGDEWQRLEPLFRPNDRGWCEAVARCCRDVGFRSSPETFADFIETVIEALAVAA
jgi:hypothetical protein